ncbi:diguanylate cyclase (GGDEF) domain-containing protein [Altererythrobacter xiamenensis]|uniref:Diguanylate cyclase (GGDEF) domain-containing protein n=2 Tax=Altererythrobacter xiamenensis TaxID=1316679 RepID=A0A1Y6FJ75_9SPHN|nr:diguanylate cyclase (GGDEF) domain-containing protein [Altererythrobacter xiamenensis]
MPGFLGKKNGTENRGVNSPGGLSRLFSKGRNRHKAEMLDSFETSGLGWFWSTDADGKLTYLSENAIRQIGRKSEEIIGCDFSDLCEPDEGDESDDGRKPRPIAFLLRSRNSISKLTVRITDAEEPVWWQIAGKPQFDAKGRFCGYRGSAKDHTEAREREREASRLAQYDPLTGLSNRLRIKSRLTAKLSSYRNTKRSCSLIMLGLDRFKHVNDTLGHQAGDELLKQVAKRLSRLVDDKGEVARLGSDEFLVILPDMDDRGELADLANQIIQMLSQPYSVNGMRAIVGVSVGIASAPYDGVDTDEIIKAADLALNAAKDVRASYRFYSSELKDGVKRRRQIEEDLRDALVHGQLQMHYQPIVDAETKKLKCLEALMRWEHPERGMVSPALFIPVAEDIGLIKQMGEWALEEACRQALEWPQELRVAVNVSAIQFMDEDFPQKVERALLNTGIAPRRVELEITESVFMGDQTQAQRTFAELKALGVRLALDDFGTGYSSLSYLRNAPFDKIKIDQSFVRGSTDADNNNSAIIASIVSLAAALKMETVAEGVETKDELELVTKLGASSLQGRLFSFAITHEELMERIAGGDLTYEAQGPDRYRADRRTEYRRIGLVHDDHRYSVVLRNLSKTGALIEGLMDVPVGTDVVLDLGGGQLAVATVRRSMGISQGVEFETPLISDGAEGLCTRHRVSPYQIEAAGRPLASLPDDPYAVLRGNGDDATMQIKPRAFRQVAGIASSARAA